MKISIRDLAGVIVGVTLFFLYVSSVRPVGWFDSVVGLILAGVGFYFSKKIKGFKK